MATVIRYVDTASSGGDGTTQTHSGSNAAYASLTALEAAEQTNLVSDGDTFEAHCAGSATKDTTIVLFNGWTTGSSNLIVIKGDPSAPDGDGVNTGDIFSDSFYIKHQTGLAHNFECRESYMIIENMQFLMTGTGGNDTCFSTSFTDAPSVIILRNNRFKNTSSGTTNALVRFAGANTGVRAYNNIFESPDTVNTSTIQLDGAFTNCDIYNNTIEGGNFGIWITSSFAAGTAIIRNNAIFNSSGANQDIRNSASAPVLTIEFNAADDDLDTIFSESTNVDISPDTETTDWAKAVTDYANGDYTIKDDDSVLVDAGTTGLDTVDINGVAFGTMDIGAFAHTVSDTSDEEIVGTYGKGQQYPVFEPDELVGY